MDKYSKTAQKQKRQMVPDKILTVANKHTYIHLEVNTKQKKNIFPKDVESTGVSDLTG